MDPRASFNAKIADSGFLGSLAALAVSLGLAILIAYWIGTQQITLLYVGLLLAIAILIVCALQRRAWILILFAWPLTGSTAILSLPLSGRDIATLLVVTAYFGYRILAHKRVARKWTGLDVVVLVNAIYLVVTLIIHPVGLRALGAETIGARPYFNIFLALLAYWVIMQMADSVKSVSRIPLYLLAGSAVCTFPYALAYFFPSLPSQIPFLYVTLDVGAYFAGTAVQGALPRFELLGPLGLAIVVTMCAYNPPGSMLNPVRLPFYGLLFGLACLLAAGYRNALAAGLAAILIAAWLHSRLRGVLLITLIGGFLLTVLVAGQGRLFQLPLPAQRALAFLPGRWSPIVELDVEGSTEGRFLWWRAILREHMIKDMWLGDGFGANQSDVALAGQSKNYEETVYLTGAYHSGPLTAIRYVGIVGLLLLYLLMFLNAKCAWRYVEICRGSPLQAVAIFLAIQMLWIPLHYTLLFGAYNADMPQQLFLAALLRVVMSMAEQPAALNTSQPLPRLVRVQRSQPVPYGS